MTLVEILPILPVALPILGAALVLLIGHKDRAARYLALFVMFVSLISTTALCAYVFSRQGADAVLAMQLGGWQAPFGISFVADPLSTFFLFMAQFVIFCGVLYGVGCRDKCAGYPAFFPLFLMLCAGLSGGILTGDLFNFFVFAELLMISGAALTAFSDDKTGIEASYKYLFISFFATILLLIGCGSLYVSYGTLNMADLAMRIAIEPEGPLLYVAIVCLACAMFVKSAVIPFHFWQPDFHTAAPTPVHAVLSSVVVKLGVYGLLRMLFLLFPGHADFLQPLLLWLGLLGVFFGGLGAAGTYDAKRMLAYSTMGQLGFIFVGIGWGTPLALFGALVFAFNHSLIKAAMLMLAGSVASRAPIKSAAFSNIEGLGNKLPSNGFWFFLGGLALAGLPPTNGFVSKMLVMRAGVEGGEHWGFVAALAVGGLVSLLYVSRAYMRIWWKPFPEGTVLKPKGDRLIAPAILVSSCILLGLFPEGLGQWANSVVDSLGGDFWNYISAVLEGRGS